MIDNIIYFLGATGDLEIQHLKFFNTKLSKNFIKKKDYFDPPTH